MILHFFVETGKFGVATQWTVIGQTPQPVEGPQSQSQIRRSVSAGPRGTHSLTPVDFQNLQHHQSVDFNLNWHDQTELQRQSQMETLTEIRSRDQRLSDLVETAKLLPIFRWNEEEEKELKDRMAQIIEFRFYPDVISPRLPDRGKNQLNKRLLQLEADAFNMTKVGVVSFQKSDTVEDLARSVELMTFKAAEVTRSVNDLRIAQFLALQGLDADATKREDDSDLIQLLVVRSIRNPTFSTATSRSSQFSAPSQ
ncbi:hypothetical protein BLNAU_22215 [Blattamonas nauphoetae]|uniref:Uncharacterized protein n=1 Tax=Blattamonas nauphoetae TaxID=2049346 RepID=A0ABQ9WTS0_9EUKA|nr:hypothetical protein BLNAU_22215 [Blattamonas nauphoetae]